MTPVRIIGIGSTLICAYCSLMLLQEVQFYRIACWDYTVPHPGFGLYDGWFFKSEPMSNYDRLVFAWPFRIVASGMLAAFCFLRG
jgi:hypothetical protein